MKLKEALWNFLKNKPWRFFLFPLAPAVYLVSKYKTANKKKRPPKNVLIFHFGALGDALMVSPALAALTNQYPDLKVTLVAGSRVGAEIYKRNKKIKVLYFQQYDQGNIKVNFQNPDKHLSKKIFILYPEFALYALLQKFDAGISLGPFPAADYFSRAFFELTAIPCVGGFDLAQTLISERQHWVDFYFQRVSSFRSLNHARRDLLFTIENADNEKIRAYLLKKGIKKINKIAVIHPGGALHVNSKRWDVEKFAQVADVLNLKHGFLIAITGALDERKLAQNMQGLMQAPALCTAGELSLGETAALLKKAELCITNDTGILHLADAAGTQRIISLWGPTDPKRIAPRNSRNQCVVSRLECSPCIDVDAGDESKRCNRDIKEECLRKLPAEDVIKLF